MAGLIPKITMRAPKAGFELEVAGMLYKANERGEIENVQVEHVIILKRQSCDVTAWFG
jgi:hypothetical protein